AAQQQRLRGHRHRPRDRPPRDRAPRRPRLGARRGRRRRDGPLHARAVRRALARNRSEARRAATLRAAMLNKVAFTMYPVTDSTRARQFYETTLGLVRGSSSPDGVWTEYDLPGGGCLALFKGGDLAPSASAGGSVAVEVDDLDALCARLKAEGVRFKA